MNFLLGFTIICLSVHQFSAHEEDIHTLQYNGDNFASEIAKTNHFVMFFAPWCGHCKRLAPTWEELAEMLNQGESNVRIAKVDCTVDGDLCNENDVTGYPTLKFFKVGDAEAVKFRGTRDLPSLTAFINEQISLSTDDDFIKVPEIATKLIELNEDTFERHVAVGKHFVKFYAPWCGHCQKLAPVWEDLANALQGDERIQIAKLDCTQYRAICTQFDVKGYPTLLWIEDGKKIEKFQGQRTLDDLKSYVQKMLGNDDDDDSAARTNELRDGDDDSHVMVLTGDDFQHGIEKGVTFVKFFAPWCGHCKRLAPTWDELGKKFIGHPEVDIVKVDCTLEANKQLCNDQDIEGFPSVFIYKNGQKISEYNGNRSLQDLYDFVQKHLGGHDEL